MVAIEDPASGAGRAGGLGLQLLNVAVLVAVLVANAMAGAGTISGESIGLIANRHRSYFLPANWVFAIWSLIYLALIGFTVYQALPAQRTRPLLGRLGLGWAVNGLLNIAWVVTFSFSLFGPALAIMVVLLVNLVWIHERVGFGTRRLGWGERLFVAYPFALYLAWISVALVANTFQFVTYVGWGGFGIPGPTWSVIMMVATTVLSVFMVFHRGNWIFPLVVGWAFVGLADRFSDLPQIGLTAYALTATGLFAMAVGMMWRRGRETYGAPAP